jgi:hypothetical protein
MVELSPSGSHRYFVEKPQFVMFSLTVTGSRVSTSFLPSAAAPTASSVAEARVQQTLLLLGPTIASSCALPAGRSAILLPVVRFATNGAILLLLRS